MLFWTPQSSVFCLLHWLKLRVLILLNLSQSHCISVRSAAANGPRTGRPSLTPDRPDLCCLVQLLLAGGCTVLLSLWANRPKPHDNTADNREAAEKQDQNQAAKNTRSVLEAKVLQLTSAKTQLQSSFWFRRIWSGSAASVWNLRWPVCVYISNWGSSLIGCWIIKQGVVTRENQFSPQVPPPTWHLTPEFI